MNVSKTDAITLAGAAAGALFLGKLAHSKGKPKLLTASYAVSGIAIGAGVTTLVMLKTGIKKNEGWNDLVVPIYIIAGVGLLGVSELAYYLLRK